MVSLKHKTKLNQLQLLIEGGDKTSRYSSFIVTVWETVAPPNFICLCVCLCVCVCICVSVCLSRFYGLYLGYYGLDFDQTWWECWNFGPIDCVKI